MFFDRYGRYSNPSRFVSRGEKVIKEVLERCGFKVRGAFRFTEYPTVEFDLIAEKEGRAFLIEYDGSQLWSPSRGEGIEAHATRTFKRCQIASKYGVPIIFIHYHDTPIVEFHITNALNADGPTYFSFPKKYQSVIDQLKQKLV